MDIRFSCSACGHHMIIDQAGAGLTIECPECGADTVVPKFSKPASEPNPQAPVPPDQEKERTVALKWTPPQSPPHVEPKK